MDKWSRARFKSLFWPHWLDWFWSCCHRSGRAHRDCNIIYQFLWRYMYTYQDSFNLQQRQTMVHCKTQTAPSGQRSSITQSITVWFNSATKSDLRRLRRVVRTAERIIGTTLPTLQELYLSRASKRAGKITLDPSHPAHSLFELLPSGRRYRALSTRTTRHRNSFFPQAVHLMNTWH